MWLLEQLGDVFQGRRLWLRPGKTYLFGRTASEPGVLVISHKTISRKHMTIQVDAVAHGEGQNLASRSKVTVEDLGTKSATTVDGQKFKSDKRVITGPTADIKLGNSPDVFRLSWQSVVLTFSFTSRELQAGALNRLRDSLEQLDIKFVCDYDRERTTHVVSKKRNTSKGLQALINGRYIVTDSFVDAIISAASPSDDDADGLEQDYDTFWPDPLQHLPPRGGEPVERPTSAYAPDEARQEIFEGYTFIFYDKTQFENLIAPITNGKGKALYTEVVPEQTPVDDFVRFVKTEAGEKGLGSFEDGSEGRGVVVVRFTPNKGNHMAWYANFFTEVSLRLDHRPIEQNEFLEAILMNNAAILRRPLEVAGTQDNRPDTNQRRQQAHTQPRPGDSLNGGQSAPSQGTSQDQSGPSGPAARRARGRRAPTRRFAGFDNDDDDSDGKDIPPPPATQDAASGPIGASQEEGLFVSQEPDPADADGPGAAVGRGGRAPRKRQADDIMEDIIPTAAAVKRRRIAAGEEPVPNRQSETAREESEPPAQPKASKAKKVKKEIDVLEEARKRREEVEALARAEREDLANLPSDVDLDAIRRLQIVEEMEVRQPVSASRSREQDIADGRWDPRWNGRRNFKKFQQRGVTVGRTPMRVIVSLTEVKKKEFGIGDDYWLEDDSSKKKSSGGRGDGSQRSTTQQSQPPPSLSNPTPARAQRFILSDDSSDEDITIVKDTPVSHVAATESASLSGPRGSSRRTASQAAAAAAAAAAASTQSQNTGTSGRRTQQDVVTTLQTTKRPARAAPAQEPPAKKARNTRRAAAVVEDSEDSDDELKFKFGRRR